MLEWFTMIDSGLMGIIIQSVAIVGSGAVAGLSMFFAMKNKLVILSNDIRRIEKGQEALNEAFKQLGSILTQVAVQDTRIAMMEKSIDELRHGNGYIKEIN
jgi:K+/H+ antiporter YhaU regulatory subunit KhtT